MHKIIETMNFKLFFSFFFFNIDISVNIQFSKLKYSMSFLKVFPKGTLS